eukprot:39172-Chlamydomonas_euryale.AAC.1
MARRARGALCQAVCRPGCPVAGGSRAGDSDAVRVPSPAPGADAPAGGARLAGCSSLRSPHSPGRSAAA